MSFYLNIVNPIDKTFNVVVDYMEKLQPVFVQIGYMIVESSFPVSGNLSYHHSHIGKIRSVVKPVSFSLPSLFFKTIGSTS